MIRTSTTRICEILLSLLLVSLLVMAVMEAGAATLEWQLPTETENGEPLAPADITAVTVYRNGQPLAGLPGTASSHDVPSCRPDMYTVTATAYGLQSQPSNSVRVEIDQVGCRPKSPAGAAVR
jgi:hypothetical protein